MRGRGSATNCQSCGAETSPWRTVAEAARYTRRGENKIRAAAASQELRGYQVVEHGPWTFHVDDLDRWVRGEAADVRPDRQRAQKVTSRRQIA